MCEPVIIGNNLTSKDNERNEPMTLLLFNGNGIIA